MVYGLELRLGWELFRNSAGIANEGYLDGLAFLILGIYGIALVRAWELLGAAPRRGLLGWLLLKRTQNEQEEVHSEQDDAQRPDLEDDTSYGCLIASVKKGIPESEAAYTTPRSGGCEHGA